MARFFVNRPIVAIVISIITVLLGVVAMSGLPISQYPEVVPPMIQVTTTFIGASATDVEASVATPLEQKINGVENMIYMKSTNANDGTLTLKVSFEVGSNLDMNNVLTQNRVSEGMPQMPQSVKNYGVSVKKALAFPLLVISIKSPNGTYDNNFLSNYTTINVNDAIARISGVGQINLFGGSDYAMRVWLRPDRIGRLGLTVLDDDLGFFPKYDAVVLMRADIDAAPLARLAGSIDAATMIAMNGEVELDGRSFAETAKKFLAGGFATASAASGNWTWRNAWRAVMPSERAACAMPPETLCSPAWVLRTIGSSA